MNKPKLTKYLIALSLLAIVATAIAVSTLASAQTTPTNTDTTQTQLGNGYCANNGYCYNSTNNPQTNCYQNQQANTQNYGGFHHGCCR